MDWPTLSSRDNAEAVDSGQAGYKRRATARGGLVCSERTQNNERMACRLILVEASSCSVSRRSKASSGLADSNAEGPGSRRARH